MVLYEPLNKIRRLRERRHRHPPSPEGHKVFRKQIIYFAEIRTPANFPPFQTFSLSKFNLQINHNDSLAQLPYNESLGHVSNRFQQKYLENLSLRNCALKLYNKEPILPERHFEKYYYDS